MLPFKRDFQLSNDVGTTCGIVWFGESCNEACNIRRWYCMYPFLMRLNYNGNISTLPSYPKPVFFLFQVPTVWLPFSLLSGCCCHLMSEDKIAMSLLFPKDSHRCASLQK